jgi:hypothetical protein
MSSPRLRGAVLALLLALAPAVRLSAQDSLPPRPPPAPAAAAGDSLSDTTKATPLGARPVSPGGALLRSIILPGWGQAKLGRKVPAIIFLTVEGVSLGMALKANAEYQYLRDTDPDRATGKSLEREDWLVVMGFNHLLAGVEAYVSAHLWDFPGDVALVPVHGGGVAAALSVPVRVR